MRVVMAEPAVSASDIDWRGVLSHPAWRLVVPLLITGLALYVLWGLSQEIGVADIRQDFQDVAGRALVLSVAAMAVSYLALSLYDVIILRSVTDVQLPHVVPMLTGISSMAVSNMLGFSWLTGGAVRYRVYAAFGVDLGAVARLIAVSWIALFVGLIGILAVLLIVNPSGLSAVTGLSPRVGVMGGAVTLALICGYFVWSWPVQRNIGIGRFRVDLPTGPDGLKMIAISVIDLAAMAMTLYVLLPPDLSQNIVLFFVVFMAALGLGLLSHSPGGLGVFEATMIAGLGASGRSDALAALVMYRLVYTVLPFALAVVGLALAWAFANRSVTAGAGTAVLRTMRPIVPLIAAGLAMVAGAVLLISGNLPSDPMRLGFLREVLPLGVIETSHLLGSVSGVMLLIVARGLYRRMFRAWLLAMALLAAGLILSLVKGIDWEEAATMAAVMGLLWVFRDAFYRADVRGALKLNGRWVFWVALLVAAISWIGFFAYDNVAYSNVLWWQFAWQGDASRFLRGTLAVAVVLAALMLNMLLTRQSRRLRREPVPDVVRQLVVESDQSDAGIALSGDKRFLIAPDNRAFIAYADTGRTLVSKGDPVGDREAGVAVIWQLRELADRMGRRCAFYGVSKRYLPTYLDLGLQVLKFGEVARVTLQDFSLEGSRRKDWRHAKARAGRDGYVFEIIKAGALDRDLDGLRAVSDAWLALKKSEEKGFSLGWFNPDYLRHFDLAVLRHAETGKITAFANLMQSGDGEEVTLDLMRYDPSGSGAAMDALFAEMLLWARDQGFKRFLLGAAPLSGLETHHLASAWHRIGSFLYQHGDQFYRFEGLRSYKEKFDPVWSPEFLASDGKWNAARVLYEVSLLIARGVRGMKRQDDKQV